MLMKKSLLQASYINNFNLNMVRYTMKAHILTESPATLALSHLAQPQCVIPNIYYLVLYLCNAT